MTKVLRPHDYKTSVFINCPFDSAWDVNNLTFADFSWVAHDWINNNPA